MTEAYLFYHVQNDVGESAGNPNAARLYPSTPGRVYLSDVYNAFPLAGAGTFAYRFQVLQDKQPLYLDILGPPDSTAVPMVNGNVICKVLRLDTLKSCSGRAATEGEGLRPRVVPSRPRLNNPTAGGGARPGGGGSGNSSSSSSGGGGTPNRSPPPSSSPSSSSSQPSTPLPTFVMPAMPAMGGGSHHEVPKEVDGEELIRDTGVHHDIYAKLKQADASGMRPVKAVEERSVPLEVPQEVDADLEGKSDFVKASVMARRNEERARVEARLAELEARNASRASEEVEGAAARGKHEARIKEWATDLGGAKKPIRVLISTMHNVLWEGAKWEAVPIGKLLVAQRVKIHFLKAVTVVHPDKASGLGVEKAYIANVIFHALEESWRIFVDSELGGTG